MCHKGRFIQLPLCEGTGGIQSPAILLQDNFNLAFQFFSVERRSSKRVGLDFQRGQNVCSGHDSGVNGAIVVRIGVEDASDGPRITANLSRRTLGCGSEEQVFDDIETPLRRSSSLKYPTLTRVVMPASGTAYSSRTITVRPFFRTTFVVCP